MLREPDKIIKDHPSLFQLNIDWTASGNLVRQVLVTIYYVRHFGSKWDIS